MSAKEKNIPYENPLRRMPTAAGTGQQSRMLTEALPLPEDEYVSRFLAYLRAERHYSERTIEVYEPTLRHFVATVTNWRDRTNASDADSEKHVGHFDWQLVTAEDIREWVIAMMEAHLEPATVNKRLSALRSFFRFMIREGFLKVNPTLKVRGPKKKKELPYFVREKDMDRLLDDIPFPDSFEGRRDHLILLLFYNTGIRLSELVGMDVDSVDFHTNTIKVLGKRNKQRIIPIGNELRTALIAYTEDRARQDLARSTNALFFGRKSLRINKSTVEQVVKHYLSLVTTIRKRSPHVLRHTFATAMLNHGADIEVVKQLLGHQSIATTEIYTHTTLEELKKIYAQAHPHAEKQ